MLNSTREKYLAIIAAVCLLAAVGWESCSALVFQPLAGLEQELQVAETAVENGSFEELRLMHAVRQLKQRAQPVCRRIPGRQSLSTRHG